MRMSESSTIESTCNHIKKSLSSFNLMKSPSLAFTCVSFFWFYFDPLTHLVYRFWAVAHLSCTSLTNKHDSNAKQTSVVWISSAYLGPWDSIPEPTLGQQRQKWPEYCLGICGIGLTMEVKATFTYLCFERGWLKSGICWTPTIYSAPNFLKERRGRSS